MNGKLRRWGLVAVALVAVMLFMAVAFPSVADADGATGSCGDPAVTQNQPSGTTCEDNSGLQADCSVSWQGFSGRVATCTMEGSNTVWTHGAGNPDPSARGFYDDKYGVTFYGVPTADGKKDVTAAIDLQYGRAWLTGQPYLDNARQSGWGKYDDLGTDTVFTNPSPGVRSGAPRTRHW